MTPDAQIGTVSHGTLRPEDLMASFAAEYKKLGGRPHNVRYFRTVMAQYKNAKGHDEEDSAEEELSWALEDLFDLLNELAPDGAYFGAHEGDGSDFGFWASEEVIL